MLHKQWLLGHLLSLFDFGKGAVVYKDDFKSGGFGYLDRDGNLDAKKPRELWINGRFTHVYALGHILGVPLSGELCDHGISALCEEFYDKENGGYFSSLKDLNNEPNNRKEAYAQAFVVLAFASATLAKRKGAAENLYKALDLIDRHFWDEKRGIILEGYDREFKNLEPYIGANANMHSLECFLAASDALNFINDGKEADKWLLRGLRIAQNIVKKAKDHRIIEHFTSDFEPIANYNEDYKNHPFRPYGATPGHGFEWSRLCLHLHDALLAKRSDVAPRLADFGGFDQVLAFLLHTGKALFERALNDGLKFANNKNLGFVYTTDFAGKEVIEARMHWVVCEAIASSSVLYSLTKEARYLELYKQFWDLASLHFIDGSKSWHHELDKNLKISSNTWSGKPDLYHAVQTCIISLFSPRPSVAKCAFDAIDLKGL
ncbi:MAG: AGE family epimerase/isomerase [Helicobacter sp.]|nr:AGE family epimerase/isomerase [Helicobacter sp.]